MVYILLEEAVHFGQKENYHKSCLVLEICVNKNGYCLIQNAVLIYNIGKTLQ